MERVKSSSSSREKTVCRYGKGCFKFKCPFHHPEGRTIDQPSNASQRKVGSMLEHITASFAALEVKRESPGPKADVTPRKSRSDHSHEKRRTPQSANSTSSSSKGTPLPHLREPCVIGGIKECHDSFKAAGVMLMRHDELGNLLVLLGIEFRSRTEKRLHVIGGKRDFPRETHFDVAAREFWEETGELIPQTTIHSCLASSNTKIVWIGAGKYVLYVVSDCPAELSDISARYAALTTKDEMLSLHWCRWNDLLSKNTEALPEQISGFLQQIIDDLMRLKVIDSFMTSTVEKEADITLEENKIIIPDDEFTTLASTIATTLLEDLITEAASPQEEKSTQDGSSS